jgi:hypothetical protein
VNKILIIIFGCVIFFCTTPVAEAFTITRGGNSLGLVGWWTFDGKDMTPNVRDASGNGNHLNLLGQATTTTVGKLGQALQFSGSGYAYGSGAQTSIQSATKATISAWMYKNATTDAVAVGFNDQSWRFELFWAGDNNVYYVAENGVPQYPSVSFATTGWHHIVITFDGTQPAANRITGYIDGVAQTLTWGGADAPTSLSDTLGGMYIGRDVSNVIYNTAKTATDDVRVFNRNLSASEVRALYNQSAGAKQGVSKGKGASDGLIGHWTFDGKDMSPNVRDVSGQGNHGNLSGQVSTTTIIGRIGQALALDGTDDVVNAGSSSAYNFTTGDFTLSFWMKTLSAPSVNDVIISRGVFATDGWYIQHTSPVSQIRMASNPAGEFVTSDASVDMSVLNVWRHVVFVKTGQTGILYTDMATAGSATFSNPSSASRDLLFGAYNGSSGLEPNVALDDIRIYNRPLSVGEIRSLYNQGAGAKQNVTAPKQGETGLVGHWTFDGKNMLSNIRDSSGRGNHGFLMNQTPTTTSIGKIGQALKFDGVNDYVNVQQVSGLQAYSSTNPYTVAFWYKIDVADAGYVFFNEAETNFNSYFSLSLNYTGAPGFGSFQAFVRDSAGVGVLSKLSVGTNGTYSGWHHIAWTDNVGTSQLYYDGLPISASSGDWSYTPGSLNPLTLTNVGRSVQDFGYMNGSMDDVRVYNKALTAAEVKQLYLMGK